MRRWMSKKYRCYGEHQEDDTFYSFRYLNRELQLQHQQVLDRLYSLLALFDYKENIKRLVLKTFEGNISY